MLRTKSQRIVLCRTCPVARVADIVGDSCSLLILRDLLEKPRRFSEIEKSLAGISTRTLANKLKTLEHDGLLRKASAGAYMRYELTKKGAGLREVVSAMRRYGKRHL